MPDDVPLLIAYIIAALIWGGLCFVLGRAAARKARRHNEPLQEDTNETEEEIRAMVDPEEKEMIQNVLEFGDLTAGDIMVHRTDMTALPLTSTFEEIKALIEESGYSRFPVYDEDMDDIVGVLSARAFLLNPGKPLSELLRTPYAVPESVAADVLFRNMQRQKVHMAVVVDEYGGTGGIITMEDLLERIVGDIYDESDDSEADTEIVPLENDKWRVAGSCELTLLGGTLGVELPVDEEFKTLGGLVFDQLSQIPEDGSQPVVEAFGLKIQVEELVDRRVEWATVEKLERAESISNE
ncbi:MAG: hemolysin family protein [Clostridia bacterium]|nr:hemolysin family protein [Clostridia bacterium]